MRRSLTDPEWADEVVSRYIRRRDKVQQREKALADLKAAILDLPEYRLMLRFLIWLDLKLA